jgi:hypothetical protein
MKLSDTDGDAGVYVEIPDDPALVLPQLRPRVRSRAFYEQLVLVSRLERGQMPNLVFREICLGLGVEVVYDEGGATRRLDADDFAHISIPFSDALDRSLENLLAKNPHPFTRVGQGVYSPKVGDGYDISRMLLLSALRELPLLGELIVLPATADLLLVCSSSDPAAIKLMLSLAEVAEDRADVEALALYSLDEEDVWRPYSLPEDHIAYRAWRELNETWLSALYQDQKELLDSFHRQDGTGSPALEHLLEYDGEDLVTTTRITSGPALLPEVDLVGVEMPGDIDPPDVRMVAWNDVIEAFGAEIQKRTDLWPPRWEIQALHADHRRRMLYGRAPGTDVSRFVTPMPVSRSVPAPAFEAEAEPQRPDGTIPLWWITMALVIGLVLGAIVIIELTRA